MSWDRIGDIIHDFIGISATVLGYFTRMAEIIRWNIPSHVHKITPETMVHIGNEITDRTIMRLFTMNGGNGGGGIEEDQCFKPNSWGLSCKCSTKTVNDKFRNKLLWFTTKNMAVAKNLRQNVLIDIVAGVTWSYGSSKLGDYGSVSK